MSKNRITKLNKRLLIFAVVVLFFVFLLLHSFIKPEVLSFSEYLSKYCTSEGIRYLEESDKLGLYSYDGAIDIRKPGPVIIENSAFPTFALCDKANQKIYLYPFAHNYSNFLISTHQDEFLKVYKERGIKFLEVGSYKGLKVNLNMNVLGNAFIISSNEGNNVIHSVSANIQKEIKLSNGETIYVDTMDLLMYGSETSKLLGEIYKTKRPLKTEIVKNEAGGTDINKTYRSEEISQIIARRVFSDITNISGQPKENLERIKLIFDDIQPF